MAQTSSGRKQGIKVRGLEVLMAIGSSGRLWCAGPAGVGADPVVFPPPLHSGLAGRLSSSPHFLPLPENWLLSQQPRGAIDLRHG